MKEKKFLFFTLIFNEYMGVKTDSKLNKLIQQTGEDCDGFKDIIDILVGYQGGQCELEHIMVLVNNVREYSGKEILSQSL